MKNILGLPLYHVSNVGMDLIPDLQDSIEKLQTEKQHWDRQKSKLSIYTEEGEHKFKLKIDPMEGVKGWEELRKRIKDHVMNYYYFTQPIDDDFQEGPDSKLRDSLKNFWHNYAWYTYFDETDSYGWHAHTQYYLIVTYYVRADEEHAPIQFKSPVSDMYTSWTLGTKKAELKETIQPKTGDIMIWPAWLEHQVPSIQEKILDHSTIEENYKYTNKRISITNCFVKPHQQFLHTQRK
jgi:hypothetical protein|tara:strand:- start:13344 stop:14054 length:711 start_codon:yes stop_codon:yes gene_type:complete